ncbi:hypothetical protein Lesp02_84220 [Lentzea sp. NBRC 105346]|uniref:hypothetical protein n=1 Tax=Lentzea sp. NBRC 105346 TaxID=3032205 RepID=UPI0024A48E85|nr:hypothetical protein [Lentzea sp. NBRC 105346]GLZ36235.1 hypothetical protein Lesp02_84220 [Lentzea sp. NBRC 105346]
MRSKRDNAGPQEVFRWSLLEERAHARTVACPAPPKGCGQPVGADCLGPPPLNPGAERQPFSGSAHHARIKLADQANPDNARPALPPEPDAGGRRHLVAADKLRSDLAPHRVACDHCGRSIVWAFNAKGDKLPVDADPDPTAIKQVVLLSIDGKGFLQAVYLNERQAVGARHHGQQLHQPHRETCRYGHLWSRFKK